MHLKNSRSFRFLSLLFTGLFFLFYSTGCLEQRSPDKSLSGEPDNGGLLLPGGFEAIVVNEDSIGPARHLSVRDNGDIYVKFRWVEDAGSMAALRDTTGDGRTDIVRHFGDYDPGSRHSGIEVRNGYLYYSTDLHVYRYRLTPGRLLPEGPPDTLVIDDHEHGIHQHITKPLVFDNRGNMFVPFGVPSNACQDPPRIPGAPGVDPCPELENHGGIWVFDENRENQTQSDGYRYATGLRSIVAMDWNPVDNQLYVVQHGRDHLNRNWPEHYSSWDNAVLPAEEFVRVSEGSNFGWPYCYYDQIQEKKVLAPEYGGDGNIVGRCSEFEDPLIGFPGHFAPNALLFYEGDQFPGRYKNGAFIAFHGSTIRTPYPQAGYFVAFVPFEEGQYSGDWEVFANGFAGVDPVVNTRDAKHRPMGLTTGPDGSLYISDSVMGKIWRIIYTGDRDDFGEEQLARMNEEKRTATNIRTPHRIEDNLQTGIAPAGENIYRRYCADCHQSDGQGSSPRFPPLADTDWVTGSSKRLISIILNGMAGPIMVRDEHYDSVMPAHDFLSDEDVAEVATYIRQNFGNRASAVSENEVEEIRNKTGGDD
ncbi:MAG: c-type cytochrome [Balneolaceae bacterium]